MGGDCYELLQGATIAFGRGGNEKSHTRAQQDLLVLAAISMQIT